MTLKEIREQILESQHSNWFKEAELNLNFQHIDFDLKKEGILAIYEYVEKQVNGWAKIEGNHQEHLKRSKLFFEKFKIDLDTLINGWKQIPKNQVINQWKNFVDSVSQKIDREKIIPYDTPESAFLVNVQNSHPLSLDGAFDCLVKKNLNVNFLNNSHYFTGTLLAYEFSTKESNFTKRRDQEKLSLAQLRSNFEKYFDKAESHLNEFLKTSKDNVAENTSSIDEFLNKKKESFETWYEDVSSKEKEFYQACHSRIEELEQLYNEKLKLEAPAKYWRVRARRLNQDGMRWLYWTIGCTGSAVLVLFGIILIISTDQFIKLFSSPGIAIRWSIVFIALISFLAFSIRTFSKLSFSAFHLKRDAEEKEQLAYVYLALRKDKNIDDTERHLVMQSIFSRADSGLLKDDASPTMPGNIMDKMMSNK